MAFEKGKEAEERPLKKTFGFTFATGFFVSPAEKRLLCFPGLHGNIDLVFDFLLILDLKNKALNIEFANQ